MIQLITNEVDAKKYNEKNIDTNKLDSFNTFDEYDLNIIDLSYSYIWRNVHGRTSEINIEKDFLSLAEEIFTSNQNILIILPQNIDFITYCNRPQDKAHYKIKDIKSNVMQIIYDKLYNVNYAISYGTSKTVINNSIIPADFYFDSVKENEIVTSSEKGSRVTTIKRKNVYVTTLNLMNNIDNLLEYIDAIFQNKQTHEPEWLDDIIFHDDSDLLKQKEECEKQIVNINNKLKNINENLDKNKHIKSILYTSGDELVNIVNSILEEILEYSLKDFKDECEEDFLIKKENVTFIGEIKGINTNVKRNNITQTSTHVALYLDKLEEQGIKENTKGILIINHQRDIPIKDRVEIPDNVLKIANINNILVIQTIDLLKIYEKYLNKEYTTDDIINIFTTQKGLIKIK